MADRRHAAGGTQRGPLIGGCVAAAVIVIAGGVFVLVNRSHSGDTASAAAVEEVENVDLQVTPSDTTGEVRLDQPVVVHISAGHLDAVMAASPSGNALTGAMAPDGSTWLFMGTLEPAATYSVSATGTTPKGHPVARTTTFTTLAPTDTLTPTITPSDGLTVGVAQPVVVRFNEPVADKREMLKRVDVTASDPVFGAWHWFTDKELHFRPQEFWPSGEKIDVTVDVTGWDNGEGVWGDGIHTSHFEIGDARVSTVDLGGHTMTVTQNGEVVKTVPVSAGSEKYPTMTGTHIVQYRQQDVLMDSSTVGIPRNSADGYYEHVYWDVAISDSGEFVHAAPWSQRSQGNSNVSHGCVNLSDANAEWFFNFSRMGDAIKVINGPRDPELGDHGVMDWDTPWDVWMTPPGSAG